MLKPTASTEKSFPAAAHANGRARSRILIVDDHPLVRDGLTRFLSQQKDLVCCGQAGTAPETFAAVRAHRPDLVILDLRLKNCDGLELIKSLKAQFPDLLILILSQYGERIYVERALRAGARGYLLKEQAAEEVLNAVRTVLDGSIYLTRGMAALLLGQLVGPKNVLHAGVECLSDRELQVFQLLGAGLSTREVASELNLSFKTVETYRENIKRKLSLQNAVQLVSFATQWATQPSATDSSAPSRLTSVV